MTKRRIPGVDLHFHPVLPRVPHNVWEYSGNILGTFWEHSGNIQFELSGRP
jgi:hypothetical protein